MTKVKHSKNSDRLKKTVSENFVTNVRRPFTVHCASCSLEVGSV
jgi:hypothetical protein